MRALLLLLFLVLTGSAAVAAPAADLRLTITLTRGERSKDSQAVERKITIDGTVATYDVTFSGRPDPANQPQHRTVTLSNDEVKNLKKLVDQYRWQQGIEKREFNGPDTVNYFSLAVIRGSGSKENTLLIMGMPRHPLVRPDKSFIFADKLLVEVFRIMHEHDPEITYVSVVD